MIRWAARLFLLRILPRRLVPFLTVLELAMLARGILRGRRAAQGSAPSERTWPTASSDFRRGASSAGRLRPPPTGPTEAPEPPRQVGPEAGATVRR